MNSPKTSRISLVKKWLANITSLNHMIETVRDTGWVFNETVLSYEYEVYIYTHVYRYFLRAVDLADNGRGYLGCTVIRRLPHLGECWRRGNDLPDGPLTRDTWVRIKNAIIGHELEKPVPGETSQVGTFEVLAAALKGAVIVEHQVKEDGFWRLPKFAHEELPTELVPLVTEQLTTIMNRLPVEMLPELLVSKNFYVRTAASNIKVQRGG